MRRVCSVICGLIVCVVLAASPLLLQPLDDAAQGPIEDNLPAEIEELSDPKIDERNEDQTHKSSILDGPAPRNATLFLRLHLAQALRRDDPRGLLTHGLRAPPA